MHTLVRGALLIGACAGAYIVYKKLTEEQQPASKRAEPEKPKSSDMGCFQSKKDDIPAEQAPKKPKLETAAPKGSSSMGGGSKKPVSDGSDLFPRKKLDPKDFEFMNEKGKVLIKEPGSINGQPFNIGDCEDCDIYICDYIAQVQIDCCKNCRIFIGPTEASIFIRNCEGCKCIMACRQYRARECLDCDTLLYASTAPVVEESKRMRFGCFRFFYFSLAQQLEAVKLSVFDNKWSEIYDFTPADGNWTFLPLDTKATDLIKPLSDVGASFVSPEEAALHSDSEVVPLTVGLRKDLANSSDKAFLMIMPDKTEEGLKLLSKLTDKSLNIIQTKELNLDAAKAKQLMLKAGGALASSLSKKTVVGCEVAGPDALSAAQEAVAAAGGEAVAYVSGTEDAARYETNLFFEQWKDFAGMAVTK
mmetsp:Transcript_8528/g.20126  ORF Transcript_8528/g.20126 Transcript_8528/m.20126 type:complete len:418 (-) Transcript_8528:911-2164(-)